VDSLVDDHPRGDEGSEKTADISAQMNSPGTYKSARSKDIGASHIFEIGDQVRGGSLISENASDNRETGGGQQNDREHSNELSILQARPIAKWIVRQQQNNAED
jgi:hypothetical protein